MKNRATKAVKVSLCVVLFFSFVFVACKTKKAVVVQTNPNPTNTPVQHKNLLSASGKISHKYSDNGCGTVIFCDKIKGEDSLVFVPIPMSSLGNFDVDGLEISFDYRILKIHSPKGCVNGIPIQISNIAKK